MHFCVQSTPGASDGEESDDGAGDAGEAESSGGKDAPAAPVAEAEALDLSDAPEPSPSGVGMDEALESAVLLGLHTLKNAELPIQFSEFFSKHMQPHKPEGVWGGGRCCLLSVRTSQHLVKDVCACSREPATPRNPPSAPHP